MILLSPVATESPVTLAFYFIVDYDFNEEFCIASPK